MRLRSLAIPAALAVAATVGVPAAGSAAVPGCHLAGPTKVVVDSTSEKVTWGFGPDCMDVTNGGGATATWALTDPSGDPVTTIGLDIPTPDEHEYSHTFADTAPKGWYTATGTGITPSWLTQNAPVLDVKYASRISVPGSRNGSDKLTLSAHVTQWSGAAHDYVGRRNTPVALQFKPRGSTTWTYVKAARTSSAAKVTISVMSPKAGSYRLKVAETNTVWAAYSQAVVVVD